MLILQAFIQSPGETFLNLGFITIRWYGLLISFSVLIGLFVSKKLAKARNINPEYISEILPSLIIFSIIGARAYYVIFEWRQYSGENFFTSFKLFNNIIQIPAFLARQTDILVSAAKTNKIINIKKGQFMSVDSMKYAVDKVVESGNQKVMITERGTQFGYNDLIVDFRGINELKKMAPTILDVTHSVQKPNQTSGVTGGNPEYIESLARAGIVNGVDGIFIETHTDPSTAKSDGANMLDVNKLEDLLTNLLAIREATSKL